MKLSEMFEKCLSIEYTTVGINTDFASERTGDVLYIYFEASDGKEDWKSNLDFPARPYKGMKKGAWSAHRGFARVWKSAERYISDLIFDLNIKKIVTVGFSHGAAIAVLCHEYIWFNRPDLRCTIEGYGFGCPRVFWGKMSDELSLRWERFTVIRNINDLVTHLPPAIFGFSHVGQMLEIGERDKYSMIDAHRPENILTELEIYENTCNRQKRRCFVLMKNEG